MIEVWPLVLFALRLAVVAVLYLFLLSAFRALRAELSAPRGVVGEDRGARSGLPAVDPQSRGRTPEGARESAERLPGAAVAVATGPRSVPAVPRPAVYRGPAHPPARLPAKVAIPAAAAALVLVLGGVALVAAREPAAQRAAVSAPSSGGAASGAPAREPAPGRVTVGLAATTDAQVRVTVDGVVDFDGTLKAGQRQLWEGGERIQVWTDSGKTLQLSVNGQDLGAYSPAMGHPDWNRIDFGFWPGWAQ